MSQAIVGANRGFVALIVAVATIGGFMFGYDCGVINGTHQGLREAFGLSSLGEGVLTSALLVGCAAGAFTAGRLADRIGRRNVMMVGAALFLVSALSAGAAGDSAVFVLARFIGGLGVGAASVITPVYISEVTPANIRGRMSSIQQIMIITGLTGAFLGNYAVARLAGGSTAPFYWGYPAWRWMLWLQMIPAGIYFLALLAIPESPRDLVLKHREQQAEAVLMRLFGSGAAYKVGEIRATLAADHAPRLSDLRDASGRIRPIVWTGIGLAVFQQLVGINIVFYYGSVLWQTVGITEADSLFRNIVMGVLSVAACILTVLTIDRIGRKPLLLLGSAGMTLTLGLMAVAFSTGTTDSLGHLALNPGWGRIAFWSAMIYAALFNLTWGPVMWVMLGEMFPNQIRGSALSVSGLAQWVANFVVVLSFPVLLDVVALPALYAFYAGSALLSYFFVQRMVHETRGRELEAMEG